MAPLPSPIGLELGGTEHTIGKLIGKGAFGQVHAVNTKSSSSKNKKQQQWAVKLTAVPVKTTKKATSQAEIAHQRLWLEFLLYSQHMRNLTGTILPRLPPPSSSSSSTLSEYYDNLHGYRCLVMERMECLLLDALPRLVEASSNKTTINLGPVACKLIDIVEQVHKTKHILLDVKAENLMIAKSTTNENSKTTPQSFADSIRLVDLGLVKPFGGAFGHKENEGTCELQGTPLYASLHNHDLQTPSRRDDLESMLYILGEIILHCSSSSSKPPYGRGETASYLPWSQERSDQAMGKVKRAHVLDKSSTYYQQMAMTPAAVNILYDTLQEVTSYKYTAIPDYDAIREKLSKLAVKTTKKKKAVSAAKQKSAATSATTTTKTSSTARRSTRRTRASANDDDDNEEESKPAAAVKNRKTRRSPAKDDDDDDEESPPPAAKARKTCRNDDSDVSMEDAQDVDDSSEDDDDEPEDMSIDDDDNRKPAANVERDENRKPRKATSGSNDGVSLEIKGTDFEPLTVVLTQGEMESIVLGSNPTTSSTTKHTLALPDATLAASHVRLTLSKKHRGVEVKPSSKQAKVLVNRMKCPFSGTVAFVSHIIGLGGDTTVVEVKTAKDVKAAVPVKKKPVHRGRTKATAAANEAAADDSPPKNKKTPPRKEKKQRPGAIIKMVAGGGRASGDEEEEWVLEEGVCETLVIGSAPSSYKNGELLKLAGVSGVQNNHARLELINNGGVIMVKVTDLKSQGGTFVNSKKIPSGKNTMAFCGAATIQVGEAVMEILRK